MFSKLKKLIFRTNSGSNTGKNEASDATSAGGSNTTSLSPEDIYGLHGVLISTAKYPKEALRDIALHYPYRARAECALDVASMYSGGDYFEFGSAGMGTFRNFLTAFEIFDHKAGHPDTRFYAFDIFGKVKTNTNDDANVTDYFDSWKNVETDKLEQARSYVQNHNIMSDNSILTQGYFEDTLDREFKSSLLEENRKIGFAFLDCNITPSYELVFDFILGLMADKSFLYMDEYFINADVPMLYKEFAAKLHEEQGLNSYYMRNAGGFGALFRIMPDDYEITS